MAVRLLLTVFLTGLTFFLSMCRVGDQTPAQDAGEEDLFLSYRVGGSMDMYEAGDRYGHGIDIQFNGRYQLYRRIYQKGAGETPSVRDEEVGEGELDEEVFASLKSKVDSLDLSSLPKRLPDVDPRKVEIREPAETVILRARSAPSTELIEIQAHMGADRQHYPSTFLQLHDRFQQLYQRLSEKDS